MTIAKLPDFNFRIVINLFLFLLPLSFIAGNLIINLNILLIILTSIFFWKKRFFIIKLFFIDKILIILFLFSIITGLINYNNFLAYDAFLAKENLVKSITFLRYLLFYLSIRLIIENNYFNFKAFFLSSSICVIFVSFDLIFQFYSGSDIFGFPKSQNKLSGPFGDEQIAGSYLQRFGLFLFFLIPFFKDKLIKKNLTIILISLFVLIFFSIIIAGNRMPLVLFIMLFVILFLIEKKLRKYLVIYIPFICMMIFVSYNFSSYIKDFTDHFLKLSFQILFSLDQIFDNPNFDFSNMYLKEFNLGYMTWKENIIIGGGINSFYINCKINFDICTTHPHNYYLEILSELGIIGFALITTMFLKLIYLFLKLKGNLSLNVDKNYITAFGLLFFVEIFPIKTTGSFFTTGNATYIFLLIAVMVGLLNKLSYTK